MTTRRPAAALTDEHKKAIAVGRIETKAVRDYLEALRTHRPKRGRQRTVDGIRARLERIEVELSSASPMRALRLYQERIDLAAEMAGSARGPDLASLEAEFVRHAGSYSLRHGISRAAWRQVGVPVAVIDSFGLG